MAAAYQASSQKCLLSSILPCVLVLTSYHLSFAFLALKKEATITTKAACTVINTTGMLDMAIMDMAIKACMEEIMVRCKNDARRIKTCTFSYLYDIGTYF